MGLQRRRAVCPRAPKRLLEALLEAVGAPVRQELEERMIRRPAARCYEVTR